MGTNKKVSADATNVVKQAAAKGVQGFDDKAIADRIVAAFNAAQVEGDARESKAAAAFETCLTATTLRHDGNNARLDDEAFQSAWRYSMRGILPRLEAAGVSWVERTERKMADDSIKQGYKLTSYGQNISSNAQNAAIYLTVEEVTEAASLTEVRKRIKAKRDAEAEAEMSDVEKQCADLAEQLKEGQKIVLELLAEAMLPEAYEAAIEATLELIEANTIPEVEVEAEAEAVAA